MSNRKYPKLKEVDDVLGGAAAWENVDSTAGQISLTKMTPIGTRSVTCYSFTEFINMFCLFHIKCLLEVK